MSLPVAILAGGLATRLRPITETIPKALVEVVGEPFVFRQLAYLRSQGVRKVALCIGYLGDMVVDAVGDGSKFDLEVVYSADGDTLLGTGGALRRALPLIGEQFFVLYGDSFLPVDFAPVESAFHASKKSALMTVLRNDNRWDKSNVLFRDGELIEYNKHSPRAEMQFIDYGLGVLNDHVLEAYPDDMPFDLADVYHRLSLDGQLAGFEVQQRFYEIGSHTGLKEAESFFLNEVKR
jgi:MurNAc alpha-1-phosphate uridylyltransferase